MRFSGHSVSSRNRKPCKRVRTQVLPVVFRATETGSSYLLKASYTWDMLSEYVRLASLAGNSEYVVLIAEEFSSLFNINYMTANRYVAKLKAATTAIPHKDACALALKTLADTPEGGLASGQIIAAAYLAPWNRERVSLMLREWRGIKQIIRAQPHMLSSFMNKWDLCRLRKDTL